MNNALTGIERQLVMQYLIDGNVPVTVTSCEKENTDGDATDKKTSSAKKSYVSGVFPVAIHSKQMTVLEQGIIVLNNPTDSVKAFDGKKVKVQFYFNKLGLYFETVIKQISSGDLALAIPGAIFKIQEKERTEKGEFSVVLYFKSELGAESHSVNCRFIENFDLFSQPKWSDIDESVQQSAKKYLERFIKVCRSVENNSLLGNGLHLIPVCRFLAEKGRPDLKIEGRKNPPSIIYIDEARIVFALEHNDAYFEKNLEYGILLSFPIKNGPIRERTIYISFVADNIFYDDDESKSCVVCHYSSIKEEDARFLEDKKNPDA